MKNINIVKDNNTIYLTINTESKEDQDNIIKILQKILLIENFKVEDLEGAIPLERISKEVSETAEQVKFDLINTIDDIKSEVRNKIKSEIENKILKEIRLEMKTQIESELKEIQIENEMGIKEKVETEIEVNSDIDTEIESDINSEKTKIEELNIPIIEESIEDKKSFETEEKNIVSKPNNSNNSICPYCGEKLYHSRTGNGYCTKCGYNDTYFGVKMTDEILNDLKTKKKSDTVLFIKPFKSTKNHYGYFYMGKNKIMIELEKEA